MTQSGSQPALMMLPSIESWPWQVERMERTRLYQPRQARPVAPSYNEAIAIEGARPDPRGWTRQAAAAGLQVQVQAAPDPRHGTDPGPHTDELFLPAPARSWRRRGLLGPLRPRIRPPRLRPIHVIISTMCVVSMLLVGLALWAWLSERDRPEAGPGDDLVQVPITVITVSGAAEGRAAPAGASRASSPAGSFGQPTWSRRHVRRRTRRFRARAQRRQVDVDGILAAGQQAGAR